MRAFIILASAFLALAPAEKPKLVLKGPRVVFMRPRGYSSGSPTTVRIRAELQGDPEEPEKYYCLTEVWDWGDDTESTYEPDCDPYQEGTEIQRHFSATRQFRYPGEFTIRLHLKRNDDTVISGTTSIQIRGM